MRKKYRRRIGALEARFARIEALEARLAPHDALIRTVQAHERTIGELTARLAQVEQQPPRLPFIAGGGGAGGHGHTLVREARAMFAGAELSHRAVERDKKSLDDVRRWLFSLPVTRTIRGIPCVSITSATHAELVARLGSAAFGREELVNMGLTNIVIEGRCYVVDLDEPEPMNAGHG